MKHPTKEELVSFLYGEVSNNAELNMHVESCAQCRAQIASWEKLKGDLNTWQLRPARQRNIVPVKTLKWAAAAVFMIAVGFGIGRFSAPEPNIDQLRAEIETTVQQQVAAARSADRTEWIAMLRDIEEQRLADYTELRQDLETVAVVAEEKLTSTEQALSRLDLVAQSHSNQQSTE